MSNNAVDAYATGEKPMSKWTKADILYELKKVNPEIVELAKKLTVSELKCRLLERTSWHHTSSKFNRTDFYSFDEIEAESFTAERINKIIAVRPPKATHTEKSAPEFITAYVAFDVWDKNRFGRVTGKHEQREAVQYRANEKLVRTSEGVKRLSSLTILYAIAQKTKYANKERVIKKYNKKI